MNYYLSINLYSLHLKDSWIKGFKRCINIIKKVNLKKISDELKRIGKLNRSEDEIKKLKQEDEARKSIFMKIIENIELNIKIIKKCKDNPVMWLKINTK